MVFKVFPRQTKPQKLQRERFTLNNVTILSLHMAKAPKNKVEKQEQKDQENFCLTDKKLKPLLRVFVGCQ